MTGAPGLYERFYLWIMRMYRRYCQKQVYHHYKSLMKQRGPLKPLTAAQKRAVRKLWRKKGRFNYDTHELVYWATGKFDPKVVPELYIRLDMEMDLNNQMGKVVWSDKALFDMILPDVPLPKTLLRGMDGQIYDEDFEYVTPKRAGEILRDHGQEAYFYKPSMDSGEGKGIHLVTDFSESYMKTLGDNWVIQEVLKIHPLFKQLNDTAVPIMRLITFYIGGEVYMSSASMRIGVKGAITDYTKKKTGDGSIIVGVTDDGCLKEFGYHPNGEKCYETEDGFKFGGLQIPNFEKAVSLVRAAHKRLPHFRFLGWDVTIDEDGEPVIIEYNINGPGVLYYQYANGSLFGKYFKEIYEGLENKR